MKYVNSTFLKVLDVVTLLPFYTIRSVWGLHFDTTPACPVNTASILDLGPRECEDGCVAAVNGAEAAQLRSGDATCSVAM